MIFSGKYDFEYGNLFKYCKNFLFMGLVRSLIEFVREKYETNYLESGNKENSLERRDHQFGSRPRREYGTVNPDAYFSSSIINFFGQSDF